MKLLQTISYLVKYLLIGLGIAALLVLAMPERFNFGKQQPQLSQSNVQQQETSLVDMIGRAKSAVVTIRTRSNLFPLDSEPCRLSLQRYSFDTTSCTFLNNGSGVFIDKQGHIVTNAHVLSFLVNGRIFDQAASIIIELNNGQHLSAKILGLDQDSDLALLKVDYQPTHFLALPSTDKSQVGEPVFAIGTPYTTFKQTVTTGIVSAKMFYGVSHYLQTDAGLRPGNSGGALINRQGDLLGITSLSTRQEEGETIYQNFAIAANDVQHVVSQLMDNGKVDRGWLGLNGDMSINLNSISQELKLSEQSSQLLGKQIQELPYGQGIVVTGINPNGPAQQAGIRQLDIITEVDQAKIYNSTDLIAAIWNLSPGQKINMTYYRNGKQMNSQVTLGQRP